MSAPLAPWAEYAIGITALVMFVAFVVGGVWVAISRHRDPRWHGVHRGPVATDFHEATGDIPVVADNWQTTAGSMFAIREDEPRELGAGLDIAAGTARLDTLEAGLERIEWDGFVHDHDLDEFFARVDEVVAGERAYRDALLDHLIGAQS